MLASFNGTWDWTAVGTLALAIVTGVSLVFGWKSLRQGQREVEESQRPIVVPVAVDLEANGRPEERPRVTGDGDLFVPVENVGPGPALNVEATASLLDGEGQRSDRSERSARVVCIGPHADSPLLIQVRNWTSTPNFALRIEYDDVASNRWCTAAVFIGGVFEVTAIELRQRNRWLSRGAR
jgi:hypothetical protein